MENSKTKRLCALFGSPVRDGSSSRLHESFLSRCAGVEVLRFDISSMNIRPCTGCLVCSDGRACSIDDDMTLIYDAVSGSGYLSFSYPLYFSSMPGPFKNFIDRCNLLWQRNRLGLYPAAGQKGVIFATAGSVYRDMFSPSITVVSHLMNSLGGRLDRENSICIGGLDSSEGLNKYNELLSEPCIFDRAALSFLTDMTKKI